MKAGGSSCFKKLNLIYFRPAARVTDAAVDAIYLDRLGKGL